MRRPQRIEFAGPRCGAPYIDAAHGFGTTENRRTPGERDRIGCVSDQYAWDISQPLHMTLIINGPLYASIDFVEGRNRDSPAGLQLKR